MSKTLLGWGGSDDVCATKHTSSTKMVCLKLVNAHLGAFPSEGLARTVHQGTCPFSFKYSLPALMRSAVVFLTQSTLVFLHSSQPDGSFFCTNMVSRSLTETVGPRKGQVTLVSTRALLASSGILTSVEGSATLRLPPPSLETSPILLSPIEDLPFPSRSAVPPGSK